MLAGEEEVFMLDGPGMVGSDPSASDTAEPATEPTPEPAKPEPATPADGASVTFEVPGWEITASTDCDGVAVFLERRLGLYAPIYQMEGCK